MGTNKHGTSTPMYEDKKKKSPFHQQCEAFGFAIDDIKCCVNGQKIEYVLHWHVVLNTWLLKIGINISWEKVLVLEYVMFQLQQREIFSASCRLSTIGTLPVP